MAERMVIQTVVSQLFGENAYIIHASGESACAVIDPGFDVRAIQDRLVQGGLVLTAILNTHGHADHIAGNAWLKECWPDSQLVIGRSDADKLQDADANLSAQFGAAVISPPADRLVSERDVIKIGDWSVEVLDTPGHTRGHIVFKVTNNVPAVVFSGDVLFQGSIGRTDFADGDMSTLVRSIHDKLFCLADDTCVYSGHGEPTTIGAEKRYNPFVGQRGV